MAKASTITKTITSTKVRVVVGLLVAAAIFAAAAAVVNTNQFKQQIQNALYYRATGYNTPGYTIPGYTTPGYRPPVVVTKPGFEFCAVNNSTISQGCCAVGGAKFMTSSMPPTVGSVIRGTSSPMMYYYASDKKRYVFTNKDVFTSWYNQGQNKFNGLATYCPMVKQLADADLARITIGGNVTIRPGAGLVKITSDAKTYAVAKGGTLRWVTTEALAKALYGNNWNKLATDIPEAFFTSYKIGAPITKASNYNPSAEYSTSTIEQEIKLITPVTPITPPSITPTTTFTNTTGTLASVVLPTSNLLNGIDTLYRFSLTASNTGGGLSIKKVSFKVSLYGAKIASPSFKINGTARNGAIDIASSGTNCGFTATASMLCVRFVADNEMVIAPGTTKSFDLTAQVTGAVAGSSIATQLLADKGSAGGYLAGSGLSVKLATTEYNFLWSDNSTAVHSEGSGDWRNGAPDNGIKGLPGIISTLSL